MAQGRGSAASTGSNYSEEERDHFDLNSVFLRTDPRNNRTTSNHSSQQQSHKDLAEHNVTPLSSPTKSNHDDSDELELDELSSNDPDDVNIYFHIHDEESRNYTQITTYHGMVRIFNSHTWASLIFWSVVVLTCLTFFMVHCSHILYKFYQAPTSMESSTYVLEEADFPNIFICPMFKRSLRNASVTDQKNECLVISNQWRTINGRTSAMIRLNNSVHGSLLMGYSLSLRAPTEPLPSTDFTSHIAFKPGRRLIGVVNKISTVWIANERKRTCYNWWSETGRNYTQNQLNYSMELCQQEKRKQMSTATEKSPKDRLVMNCLPSCESHRFHTVHSTTRTSDGSSIINLLLDRNRSERRVQQLRIQTVDVLSAIGGGTSLFLGCSCVTIMETFVYLARSIWQTMVGPRGRCHHFAEGEESDCDYNLYEGDVYGRDNQSAIPLVEEEFTKTVPSQTTEYKEIFSKNAKPNKPVLTSLPSVDEACELAAECNPEYEQLLGPLNFIRRAPSLHSTPSSASTTTRYHLIDHRRNRRRTSAFHTNVLSNF